MYHFDQFLLLSHNVPGPSFPSGANLDADVAKVSQRCRRSKGFPSLRNLGAFASLGTVNLLTKN